ncbi:hypothetical protein BCV69DRAFT_100107 [Microstroma glucosiphilum]|uniref:Uncharacterized protein n=1 Tax=Pseudomicrostroma glucosiphilum TaxID=1684307 RepID=A0A316UCH1_9BASI|nr:hypothetical protein BCV69DRAFT_100107 [Pseudomicrostroma glucosiphilum]PWN22886.1 hypothetical protein BCV69DRAFT_100107 [Pseudomicrostroma glucosiphilum]
MSIRLTDRDSVRPTGVLGNGVQACWRTLGGGKGRHPDGLYVVRVSNSQGLGPRCPLRLLTCASLHLCLQLAPPRLRPCPRALEQQKGRPTFAPVWRAAPTWPRAAPTSSGTPPTRFHQISDTPLLHRLCTAVRRGVLAWIGCRADIASYAHGQPNPSKTRASLVTVCWRARIG